MAENLKKLKTILREMFQLDQADLDFGIYRIMNQKRDEIEQFLDRDLLPQVKTAFSHFDGGRAELQKELDEKIRQYTADGLDPETVPKVQELRRKIAEDTVDVTALENDVFSQLTNFFRRYYQGGDFLSLRRYKAGVYAIPYEGEEVKLHWANADQHYIKSSENFRDYTFKLPSGRRAHFKLLEASTEQNNKKEQAGKERRFILCFDTPLAEENGELFIRFEYRVDGENSKQASLNEAAMQTILAVAQEEWKRELSTLAPTEKNPRRTLLEKHLSDYTAKYSFDYFIHKDLGGFLRHELDFFIKNEVLFIDDLDADHIKASISKVKVIKEIGHKVIAFLEQLENFQKKLWLKKKFVVETNWCVTLDRVLEELYPVIIANKDQLEEWKRLFAIQDIEGDLHTPKFTEPLTNEFLKDNSFLVLDTAFFDREFTEKLLASFDNLDEATNGILVHSENFQALNLLRDRFKGQVKCTYIDPPYNTGNDDFPYKDSYQHSSWLSMVRDRAILARQLIDDSGAFFSNIDDTELFTYKQALGEVFSPRNFLCSMAWLKKYGPPPDTKDIGYVHEMIVAFKASEQFQRKLLPLTEEQTGRYKNPDNDTRGPWKPMDYTCRYTADERPNLFYPITQPVTGEEIWPKRSRVWAFSKEVHEQNVAENKLWWGLDGKNKVPALKNFLADIQQGIMPTSFLHYEQVGHTDEAAKELRAFFPDIKSTPKPTRLIRHLFSIAADRDSILLDYFAGTGTTAHAIINQNRDDEGSRKYILVEMAGYFNSVLKPRIQKVIYSKDWKDGKPISREGSSHLFKYIRLESYEDALNNLQLKRAEAQRSLLDQNDAVKEQYMLSYMLDVESAGSASLLDIDAFTDPFNYRMNIARGNETKETVVDLLETFNWLLGIKVFRISQKEHRTAEFEQNSEGRLQAKSRPRTCASGEGWTFQEVEGQTLGGDKVLIIWRTLTDKPEQDNLMLDDWFKKRDYSTLDFEFNRIYVNGDNNLENLKIGEERWKVALIEQEFKRLMFATEGV